MKIDAAYIPLDKSWIIRMGVLDMVNGYDDISIFLSKQKNLGDDLAALKRAAESWKTEKRISVGESGTLYRLLKYASWKLDLGKEFILQGTLAGRNIHDDPSITHLSQIELLKLDNGTSQWASAAALLGDMERIPNPPYKLACTYEAIDHWKSCRKEGKTWELRYDETIAKQAEAYLKILNGGESSFIPAQAEDFCFVYAFGLMSVQEGEKRWPALRGHESDRIVEMQSTLTAAQEGKEINSRDHRVIQAIAMWGRVNSKELHVIYPESVNKSWLQFWDFLEKYR
ncbi:MAG: hypothetical protein AAB365_01660 [Patescibacteria group bacterium]